MSRFLLQTVISLNHCDNTLKVYVPRPPQNLYYIREEQLVSEDFQGQSRGVININQHRKLCQHITSTVLINCLEKCNVYAKNVNNFCVG